MAAPNGTLVFEALVVTIPQNQVPTPFATPSFANPAYQQSSLTSVFPQRTVLQVGLDDAGSVCTTFPIIGSFTTQ